MESLIIEANDSNPHVKLNQANGKMEIIGKSLPDDVFSFYKPVLEWLNYYAVSPHDVTEFTFKLTYFNTSSSKMILDILTILEKIHTDGKEVTVNWYYPVYDEDMKEAGEEYSEMVDVHFNLFNFTP